MINIHDIEPFVIRGKAGGARTSHVQCRRIRRSRKGSAPVSKGITRCWLCSNLKTSAGIAYLVYNRITVRFVVYFSCTWRVIVKSPAVIIFVAPAGGGDTSDYRLMDY
jgi:hypothetical protein